MHGLRMHESDLQAEQSSVRGLIDQVHALSDQVGETLRQVVDLVRDVVHPRASFGQELADRSVLSERREQLDAALAQPYGNRLDALRLERVAALDLRSEQPLVRVDRLVEVLDGDAEVVESPDGHGRMLPARRLVAHRQRAHDADLL